MARVVATGNQPRGQNPFGPAAQAGGLFLGQFLASKIREKKRRGQARQLAEMFGPDPSGGQPPQVEQPQPEQGQNPFSVPAMQDGQTVSRATGEPVQNNAFIPPEIQDRMMPATGPTAQRVLQQQLERRGIGTGQETNVQRPSRPAPAAGGAPENAPGGSSGPRQQLTSMGQRPQMDATARQQADANAPPRSVREMIARMPMDQRTQLVMQMQAQGMSTPEIMELAAQQQPEPQVSSRVVSGDSRLNAMFDLGIPQGESARVEFQRDPRSGQILSASVKGRFATSDSGPETVGSTRVVSGDSELNQRFNLGIPPGENARVEFQRDPNSGEVVATNVQGRFATSGGGQEQWTTLSPEETQQLGFEQGTVVQRSSDGSLAVRQKPGSTSPDQREQEIAALTSDLEQRGVEDPRRTATNIVDGVVTIEMTETGDMRLIHQGKAAAGEPDAVRALPIEHPQQGERPEIPDEQTLFSQAGEATGPSGTIFSITSRIPGTEMSPEEKSAVEARRAFELTENEIARGLVINDRFPVTERRAVIDAVNIRPSFFDTTEAMRSRLIAADRFLRSRLEQARRDADDQNLPSDTRQAQAANASAIENAIDRLGVPQTQRIGEINADTLTSMGTAQADFVIEQMSRAEAEDFIRRHSEEQLDSLPESVTDGLREKFNDG